jgi:hypothetical protein
VYPAAPSLGDRLPHEDEQVAAFGCNFPRHHPEQEGVVGRPERLPIAERELELTIVVFGVDRLQFDPRAMSGLHDLLDGAARVDRGSRAVDI